MQRLEAEGQRTAARLRSLQGEMVISDQPDTYTHMYIFIYMYAYIHTYIYIYIYIYIYRVRVRGYSRGTADGREAAFTTG